MEILKRNKTVQRASFTKAYSKLESVLVDEDVGAEEIEMCLQLFKQKSDALELTHNNYLDALTDEVEFETEFSIVEEYREKGLRIEFKSKRILDSLKNKPNKNESSYSDNNSHLAAGENADSHRTISARLPEVELYKFGGELKDWLTFWNQFKTIHENKNLTEGDKFHYLIQSTKIRSEARELVESFPVTNENYPLAIESLTERYGRNELLIDFYVRELLKLVLNNATKRKQDSLSGLYNKLSTQLRALSSLGVTTDQCGVILYPLVESSLPTHILRSFERQKKQLESEQNISSLDAIILYLKTEVQSEEKIKLSRSEIYSYAGGRKHLAESQRFIPSAAELVNQEASEKCAFCLKQHETRFCKKAFFIPLEEKVAIIKNKGLCRVCLAKGHLAFRCRSQITCPLCSNRHLKFMCKNIECNKSDVPKPDITVDNANEKTVDSLHSRATNEVILQTLIVNVHGIFKQRKARVIIDSGSQKSYILKSTAAELGFNLQREEEFCHSLFGGTKTKLFKHDCYKIYLSSLDGKYACKLDALDQDIICNEIASIKNGSWIRELKKKHIFLSDVCDIQENAGPIEILLGADVVGKLITGRREELSTGLVALETKLGWTLMGKMPAVQRNAHANMTVVSMFNEAEDHVSKLWDLEIIGIRDPIEQRSKEDARNAVMNFFKETVQQKEDGRYEISMPWKQDHNFLPDNYSLSLKRLTSTYKKIETSKLRQEYDEVFSEWIREKIVEEVPERQLHLPAHYLPHRPVIKENTTTRIRPVFDASAKIAEHPSLNDCLETGINLIETIPSILARFRQNPIGIIADIKKAFLQISVNEKDRDFLRFLLYDEQDNVKVFRHTRVVFGVTCSPFLLGAVINYHLSRKDLFEPHLEVILEKLYGSFYVDNCVTSIKDKSELGNFIESATEIMKKGKFELRGWESNVISSTNPRSHVLGLIWDKESDALQIDYESINFNDTDKITKRKILSLVGRVFDPIGFISPALVPPKLLMQTTWQTREPWDVEVNDDIKNKFLKWFKEIDYLKYIKIPRWLNITDTSHLSLHTFVDASQAAYAACIFVRSESPDGIVHLQLLQAKTRITPLKKITIPRLELMSAMIGARLFESVKNAMPINNFVTYFWTDSSTVLTWIKRQELWSVFVHNRVTEIRKLTPPENWFHISSDNNPADLLSRGCGFKKLSKSMWWKGPDWLKSPQEKWPTSSVNLNEKEIEEEKRRVVVSSANVELVSIVSDLADKISNFSKIVRVVTWILRVHPKGKDFRKSAQLTKEELLNAQKIIFRCVQRDSFSNEEGKRSLINLQVYQDDEKMLRLKSRLTDAEETSDFICPLILPSKHPVVRRLIEQEHIANKHAGALTLLVLLRERYWILKGKRTIRSVIKDCLTCKKQRVKNLEVPFPPLPQDRTRMTSSFQICGVDLTGHLITKSKEKFWIVLFSCAVFRAVHLELVPSLSTSALIQAIRRFIARRGRVSVMYSDNGTNFTGLNTALKQLDWNKIQKEFEVSRIRWKFNPPSAPWWGGFWERLIGILKGLLRKNLGRSSLTYEELQTLVCECEAVMNNRPLTYVSEEPDLRTLTPSMFIQDMPGIEVPDLDQIERNHLVKRWKYVQNVREHLRKRFRKEYLGFLRSSFPKKQDNISIGDVVLIGTDDKRRLHWLLGRVVELFPGKDGIVRLVRLKTPKGYLLRPVQRLYPLEVTDKFLQISDEMSANAENPKLVPAKDVAGQISNNGNPDELCAKRTRSGRVVKPVDRYQP